MDFGKLANATHTTKFNFQEQEIELTFRGASARIQRELEARGAILDRDSGTVKPPEYLAVFVVSLRSGGTTFEPSAEWWIDAEAEFVAAAFQAVAEAMNPGKSTAN